MSIAIQLERVSKRYRTGRSRTLVDLVASTIGDLRGDADEIHSATRGRVSATINALSDVSFDVPQGAGLGIIGRNGAGKTTLLKLISRVSWPTSGTVRVAGHVVSLIELGAGFHPELTGRENVYLGGGLFGLTRREVARQFDAIVQFADVARLIDTPMKRYSSGLYARLGFSVAIHSHPDIVLVDEVLSVGDAVFRRRALEALRELIASGKTVLFISHDMWNVRRLCTDILWMDEGRVRAYGPAAEIAERYMNEVNLEALANQATLLQSHRGGSGEIRYVDVELQDAAGAPTSVFQSRGTLVVRATYRAERAVEHPVFQLAIVDVDTGVIVSTASSTPGDVPSTGPGRGCRRVPVRAAAAAAAAVCAAPLDLGSASAGVLRSRDRGAAIRGRRRRRRCGQPGRRAGRSRIAAVCVPPSIGAGRLGAAIMSRRVTVLVSVPHGGAAGNMLRTGIIRRLLDADPDVHLVVVSPLARDPEFVREHAHARVQFEDLPPHRPAGLEARLFALMQAAYLESGITESVRIRRAEALKKGTIRWLRAKKTIARLLAPSLVRRESRYRLSDRMVSHPWAESLFDRVQPAMLVVSNPGLIFSEVPLLRTAVRRGVRAVAVDASWDNFTNKLLPVRKVDRLIVWNDLMKQQAIELHGYQPDDIRVAGTPQWDLYFRDGPATTRDTFFRRIGADPSKKLVTLTTTPHELYPHHDHVLRVLVRGLHQGQWPAPAQVLVRLHPRDDRSYYAGFERIPGVIIEKPFRETVRAGDGMAVDFTSESQQHLADTMRHSDVIVNVASTIAIEAAIFDTPVVNVSFDGEEPCEFERSARRYYRFTHYVNITRHGAVRVAETPDELIAHVGRYLQDPALDRDGRRKVVLEQCQFLDGRSAERVANAVVSELAAIAGRPLEHLESCAGLQASSR